MLGYRLSWITLFIPKRSEVGKLPVLKTSLLQCVPMDQKVLRTVRVLGIFVTARFEVRNVEDGTNPQGHREYGSGL
jgi:hypothetical protein